jgi:hypothetical protein
MAVTLKEVEAIPASYPAAPDDLSTAAAALDADALWQRLEAYCRVRWTAREVIWTVEGEGAWEAPLQPSTLNTVEVWESGAWVECTPAASPWGGYDLPGDGPYRITADVGGGDVPAAVKEAYRRLAEYSAEIGVDGAMAGHPSHTSHSVGIGDSINESFDRPSTWAARALTNSGAADLLRPYKRRA